MRLFYTSMLDAMEWCVCDNACMLRYKLALQSGADSPLTTRDVMSVSAVAIAMHSEDELLAA